MTPYPYEPIRSTVEGHLWPGLSGLEGCGILALLYQFQQSERLPLAQIEAQQYHQLSSLVVYAGNRVPFYKERFAAAGIVPGRRVTPEAWRRLPVLTREDIQKQGEKLHANPYPDKHGQRGSTSTSGSTGKPVTVLTNQVTRKIWAAITLRDHVWHGRAMDLKFSAIRKIKGHDTRDRMSRKFDSWNPPVSDVFNTGPGSLLSINTPLEDQVKWLQEEDPAYLLVYPTNLQALLEIFRARGVTLPGLRQIRAMAEIVSPELRENCREVLGVEIADMYSAQECGYFALQCPGHDHYLVQAETMLLEVLDAAGELCGPGETGRVVVTPLFNFAMPLLRYEIGDYATVGGPSPCGRGLPVLERILGRVRNMLVSPDGGRSWPAFGTRRLVKLAPVRQYQFVQLDRTTVEARLALHRPFEGEEERKLSDHILSTLPEGMELRIALVDEVPRSAGGKYEDFVCLVRD